MNDEGGFQYNLKTLQFLFGSEHIMGLWMSALFLAVTLRFITERFHHQLIFPICAFPICGKVKSDTDKVSTHQTSS
jgi:hypothetical protein